MIFSNLKSEELTLLFVVCQSQIEISRQLNYALCTVIGKMRCNNFLFSSFVTVMTRDVNQKPENRISALETKSGFAYSVNEIRIFVLK